MFRTVSLFILALVLAGSGPGARAGKEETQAMWRILQSYTSDAKDLEPLRKAIAAGADVHAWPEDPTMGFHTPLAQAAARGSAAAVEALLAAGAAVDSTGNGALTQSGPPRQTPLMYAIFPGFAAGRSPFMGFTGSPEVVRLLLDRGADVNARTAALETPLMIAVESGQPDLVELLLEQGPDLTLTNKRGQTVKEFRARRAASAGVANVRRLELEARMLTERMQELIASYEMESLVLAELEAHLPGPVGRLAGEYAFGRRASAATPAKTLPEAPGGPRGRVKEERKGVPAELETKAARAGAGAGAGAGAS